MAFRFESQIIVVHMSINVAEEYSQLLMFGSFVHGIGILGDGSFAARVYVKRTEWFRFGSLIAVSFYSLCFTGWFVYLHMQVFKHESYVCSGHYLSADELKEPTEKYAIKQGRIMQNILIGVWCANAGIAVTKGIALTF